MENQLNSDRKKDAKTPRQTYDMLMELCNDTLGSLILAIMNRCDPPHRKYPLEEKVLPPWWPTGSEPWWYQIKIEKDQGAPPYKKPHDLRKMRRASCCRHCHNQAQWHSLDKLAHVVKQPKNIQGRMSVKEMKAWNSVLKEEAKIYSRDHLDVSVPDLPASFLTPLLSDSSNSSNLSNHVEGFQSQVQLVNLLLEQQVSLLTPSQQQQHHQVASMCKFPTEQRMMPYMCDHPMCLHHNERFGFPTAELQDQHFWSCLNEKA